MDSVKKTMNEMQKSLDSQLWHACAGGMVQVPPLNSRVLYFPQGHSEHSGTGNVDFAGIIPPYILCRVSAINLLADLDTDEVYAKIALLPLSTQRHCDSDEDGDDDDEGFLGFGETGNKEKVQKVEKPSSFAKTLTQSDANNGGGFSVPRYCAETIFPTLDYTADPPVQVIAVTDVHGRIWKFRHIYRGTPRRHLLTTGWSNFVNHKKLVAGDSVVFFLPDNGDIHIGIRRAKRGTGGGFFEIPAALSESRGRPAGLRQGLEKANCKANAESVVEAASRAASGQPFEVVYCPRASTPQFCVKASTVKAAMKIQWYPGMRFKMAFETEDSSRISWFMGTVSSVRADDEARWPNSPWRLLQVTWDEPELLQHVKRVNPWSVELMANVPGVHLSPHSSPTKKLRFTRPPDYTLFTMPPSIQGARHSSQLRLDQNLWSNQTYPFPHGFNGYNSSGRLPFQERDENISCLLTIGTGSYNASLKKKNEKVKKTHIVVLFGQPIVTESQLSETDSSDTNGSVVIQNGSVGAGSEEEDGPCVETGHCLV